MVYRLESIAEVELLELLGYCFCCWTSPSLNSSLHGELGHGHVHDVIPIHSIILRHVSVGVDSGERVTNGSCGCSILFPVKDGS